MELTKTQQLILRNYLTAKEAAEKYEADMIAAGCTILKALRATGRAPLPGPKAGTLTHAQLWEKLNGVMDKLGRPMTRKEALEACGSKGRLVGWLRNGYLVQTEGKNGLEITLGTEPPTEPIVDNSPMTDEERTYFGALRKRADAEDAIGGPRFRVLYERGDIQRYETGHGRWALPGLGGLVEEKPKKADPKPKKEALGDLLEGESEVMTRSPQRVIQFD